MSKHKKGKKPKAKKDQLTYFLDHPHIKREESVGNGSVPMVKPVAPSQQAQPAKPSIATQINWPGTKK